PSPALAAAQRLRFSALQTADRLLFTAIRVFNHISEVLGKMGFVYLFVLLFFINSFNHGTFADQIFPAHAGGSFSRSSREPKYKIEFHADNSPFHPDDDQESVVMPNKNGDKFLCFLPKVEKSKAGKPVTQQNMSSLIMESEKRIKLKTPDELLEVLKDRCFIRQEGWWTYEFCYQKKLRQLHLEDEKVVQEFVLGVYDDEATSVYNQNLSDISTLKDPRSKDASQRYHAHQYTNGTICDLTDQLRETEVRFVCSEPRAIISSITELSTCKYALTIQCPMLCKHPLFQEERPVWHTINCNAISKDQKEPKMEEESFKDEKITMVTDIEYPSIFESEEYAT
ncbi:Protein OS-9, partial [Sarracenia purpurea var. burkii]